MKDWVLRLIGVLSYFLLTSAKELVTKEFCNMEKFNVTCDLDQIILMQKARYGRMKVGKCVKRSLGFLGCAVDVLNIMDSRCSGRQKCTFVVPSEELHNTMPCPEDTTPYLEITYKCIKVSQSTKVQPRCKDNRPITLSDPEGYISSSLTSLWNVGTHRCPWKIRVNPGQRINITMFHFNGLPKNPAGSAKHDVMSRPDVCYEYAVLQQEGEQRKRISVCGGEKRTSHLVTTTKNEVTVTLVGATVLEGLGPFLLKYQAIGCPDIQIPTGGQVARKGENMTVTCREGHEIWYLTCKDTKWQGQMGNCTTGRTSASMFDKTSEFPFGILLVVAIGVALGVFLGGLLLVLAVLYMKRRQRRYVEEDYRVADTLGPRHPYHPEHKAAMMINIHSDTSPHWDHMGKTLDDPCRDTSCRTCAMPYSTQAIQLGTPPFDRRGNITGAADVTQSEANRQHIYECPKFS